MKLQIVRHVHPSAWDACAAHWGWFWHTRPWIDYTLGFTGERDTSFGVADGRKTVAICPAVCGADARQDGTYGGGTAWAPAVADFLSTRQRAAVLDLCLSEMERLLGGFDLAVSPLVPRFPTQLSDVFAATLRRGYADASCTSVIVDLNPTQDALWKDLAGRHRSSIERSQAQVEASEDPLALKRFASEYARRSSRSLSSVRAWLEEDNAFVTLARLDGKVVGGAVSVCYRRGTYLLASFANEDAGTAGHAVAWQSLLEARRRGMERYEMGIQPGTGADPKEKNIALFKRGFGGCQMPLLIRKYAP